MKSKLLRAVVMYFAVVFLVLGFKDAPEISGSLATVFACAGALLIGLRS